jgi:cytochrome c oxidase subunit IV
MTPDAHARPKSPTAHAPVVGDASHGDDAGQGHPTWSVYWKVATVLTIITVVEVYCYYLKPFVASPYFVPTLLILSAAKFAIVVMFYMHLKYDAKLFRFLFTGPLILAMLTMLALLLLFGKIATGIKEGRSNLGSVHQTVPALALGRQPGPAATNP